MIKSNYKRPFILSVVHRIDQVGRWEWIYRPKRVEFIVAVGRYSAGKMSYAMLLNGGVNFWIVEHFDV